MLTASENWARTPPAALHVEPDPKLGLLDQHDVADPGRCQVVGRAQPHHPATDDHDRRTGREVSSCHRHPRSGKRTSGPPHRRLDGHFRTSDDFCAELFRIAEVSRLSLTQLATLQAFVRTGTLAAAAENLGYTPGAVSQQVSCAGEGARRPAGGALGEAAGAHRCRPGPRGVRRADPGRRGGGPSCPGLGRGQGRRTAHGRHLGQHRRRTAGARGGADDGVVPRRGGAVARGGPGPGRDRRTPPGRRRRVRSRLRGRADAARRRAGGDRAARGDLRDRGGRPIPARAVPGGSASPRWPSWTGSSRHPPRSTASP